MSLILCRQEPVTVPLYIEDLGIHLYSSQELCYVISRCAIHSPPHCWIISMIRCWCWRDLLINA